MADEVVWVEWQPDHVPHVKGRYERRRWDASGLPLSQKVECECTRCGAKWQTACGTGQVRAHIMRFAHVHVHADPFAATPRRQ